MPVKPITMLIESLSSSGTEVRWAECAYWTERFQDLRDGFAGLRLHRRAFGRDSIAAEIVYWDATGGFTIQTIDGDVPVELIQALIEAARIAMPTG